MPAFDLPYPEHGQPWTCKSCQAVYSARHGEIAGHQYITCDECGEVTIFGCTLGREREESDVYALTLTDKVRVINAISAAINILKRQEGNSLGRMVITSLRRAIVIVAKERKSDG